MTAVAIVLATLGAACFAVAATLQHRAVGAVTPAGPNSAMTPRRLVTLAVRPGWLAGFGFGVAGGALHAVALVLAPLSVVQPVGALAVPIAVVLAARLTGRRPPAAVLAAVALTVAGVAVFVAVTAGSAVSGQVPTGPLLAAGAGAAATVALLVAVAWANPGWIRNVACATAAAIAFGFESVLLRALAQLFDAGEAPLTVLLPALGGIGVALLVGGWLVQQAFAAGPPEPVVAGLTVVDPIVAVGLAAVLLGEGARTPPDLALLLLACAAAAAAGVLALARHHPDAADRRQPPALDPERTTDGRPADSDRRRYLPT